MVLKYYDCDFAKTTDNLVKSYYYSTSYQVEDSGGVAGQFSYLTHAGISPEEDLIL